MNICESINLLEKYLLLLNFMRSYEVKYLNYYSFINVMDISKE